MSPIRFAVRSLARAPIFTAATIATIGLGIGAGCAVFALLDAVLLRPLPYAHSDRLVGLWHTMPGLNIPIAKQAPGTYALYRDGAKSFEAMGVYVSLAATLTYRASDRPPERVRLGWMTPSTFSVLGATPLLGRVFTDADAVKGAPSVVVIGERLWRTRFAGDRRVIGQSIDVDGTPREIIGVLPESFAFPESRTPVWAPLDLSNPTYVGGFGFDGIGRLRPGVTLAAAQRELQQILMRLPERFPEQRPGLATALALRQTRLAPVLHFMRDDVIAGFDRVLWLIAGTVALLVIVAFSNVASLLLVRVESRQREFAVRSALGASAWGGWRSLMFETTLVAAIGGALGLGIAATGLGLLVRAAPPGIPRLNEVRIGGSAVLPAIGLTLLCAVLCATLGALRIPFGDAMRILRDGGRTGTAGRGTQRMRAAFVAVEVALSLVLLAGSGVLVRSVVRLRAVQPGFDPSNTFTFWTFLPGASYKSAPDAARFYREAIDRMQRLPGVAAVGVTAKLPLEIEGFPYQILIWADDGTNASNVVPPAFQTTSASSGYFNAMRIPLIAGRSFDDENVRRGANEAVVSRGFIERIWHDPTGRSGVGRRVRPTADGAWFTIVGVVGDVRDSTLTLPPIAEVYFPEEASSNPPAGAANTTGRDMAFVVRTRGPAPALPLMLRQELHALDPTLPFYRPATMNQIVADARARMTVVLLLLAVGAGATLLLGAIGLYGVIAYVVSLRSREISIRIALGLAPSGAARMIVRQGQRIIAVGAVAGLGLFLVFRRLLEKFAFEVSTLDASALAGALAAVLVVATVATWIPARRAAHVDPAESLKAD
jgi:predicted permease